MTGNALLSFDSATPATTTALTISGIGAESILGIDIRPATRALYGLGSAGNLYVINRVTGNAGSRARTGLAGPSGHGCPRGGAPPPRARTITGAGS
jgi:hypothetical protein